MNTKLGVFTFAGLVLFSQSSYGLFGIGDVVFDPTNVAETINLLRQAQQEFDRLGSLLGVSVSQFDQLVSLASALGNGTEAAKFATPLSMSELQRLISAIPGLEQADTTALLNTNGKLGAFSGMPVSSWAGAEEAPTQTYSNLLVASARSRAWESGSPISAASYLQWLNGRTLEDQTNLGPRAMTDIANLLASDWLASSRQRRTHILALTTAEEAANSKAQTANSAADRESAQSQLISSTNKILLEAATQALGANETSVRAESAQLAAAEKAGEYRHDIGVMQLDASY